MADHWIDVPGPGDAVKILSIDGGGLYGLISALLLHQLDDKVKPLEFLKQVKLFAGISAGALISLILAKYDDPREGLDEAVDIFKEPIGMFSNANPVASALSLLGIGGWVGSCDYQYQLRRHFGDMRLGQLKQLVMIATFSWTGAKRIDFGPENAGEPPFWDTTLPTFIPATSDSTRDWRPKFFTNYEHGDERDDDLDYRVADVAYGAASPAGFRALRGGIADAGTYAGSPAVEAISYPVEMLRQAAKAHPDPDVRSRRGGWIDQIAMISVGNGCSMDNYWLRNNNFGPMRFPMSRTNPPRGNYYATATSSAFAGSFEDVNYMARALLGDRYYRLNPQVMQTPLAIPTLLARFPMARAMYTRQIEMAAHSPHALLFVDEAASFLRHGWHSSPPMGKIGGSWGGTSEKSGGVIAPE
jgi:hypothetical protein